MKPKLMITVTTMLQRGIRNLAERPYIDVTKKVAARPQTMKKNNIVITSERIEGERRYFIKKQAD